MKWLCSILLSALAAIIGVEGQANDSCTYELCSQLLASLNQTIPLSSEYCVIHDMIFHCVSDAAVQCGEVNSDIINEIFFEWSLKPMCSANATAPTPTPTVATDVDCTYTKCTDLFHAVNPNDTNYCTQLEEVYNCLGTTRNSCPDGAYLLNHDGTKENLDEVWLSWCTCRHCDDAYDALILLTPSNTQYCERYADVNNCVQNIFSKCSTDDELFWHAINIGALLEIMPKCNNTANMTIPPQPPCLNGTAVEHVWLNDDLPDFLDESKISTNCVASSHKEGFYYCSIYSNSHFRAFNSDDLNTCSLPGLWALVDHPSFTVTVLNTVLGTSGPYTLVDELSVIISASDCSEETTYHASAVRDYLPSIFEDGTNGVNGLELILNNNATSAYIRIPWIDTIIAIHKLAGYIGVVVRSPEYVANRSVGLCSLGCPEHSKFSVIDVIEEDPTSRCTQDAYTTCSINDFAIFNLQTEVETYYEKCIFDVLKSQHFNSSWISLGMVNSWDLLGPASIPRTNSSHSNSQYEDEQTAGASAAKTLNVLGSTLCITMVTWCLSLLYIMPS